MFDLNPLTAISKEVREWLVTMDHRRELRQQSTQQAAESLQHALQLLSGGNPRQKSSEPSN